MTPSRVDLIIITIGDRHTAESIMQSVRCYGAFITNYYHQWNLVSVVISGLADYVKLREE
jgi:hypothetical protein